MWLNFIHLAKVEIKAKQFRLQHSHLRLAQGQPRVWQGVPCAGFVPACLLAGIIAREPCLLLYRQQEFLCGKQHILEQRVSTKF